MKNKTLGEVCWQSDIFKELGEHFYYTLSHAHIDEVEILHDINPDEMLEVWHLHKCSVDHALKSAISIRDNVDKLKIGNAKNPIVIYSLYQHYIPNSCREKQMEIIGMCGVSPSPRRNGLTNKGEIWYLGQDLENHTRFVIKHAKEILNVFYEEYEYLENVVGSWNKKSQRYLRWLGFHVEKETEALGKKEARGKVYEQALFHRFYTKQIQQ